MNAPKTTALKTILRANMASCLAFGLLFLVLPGSVAGFLSGDPAPRWLIAGVGAMLLFNGAHLYWVSRRARPKLIEIVYFAGGDFLWAIATVAIRAQNSSRTSERPRKERGMSCTTAAARMERP